MKYSEKPGGSHVMHMECLNSSKSVCFPRLCCMHTRSTCIQTSRVLSLSCIQLFVAPETAARKAPLSMGFSRQGCWSGLPCPSPGDLPHPGNEPASPALAGGFFTTEPHLAFDCMLMYLQQECLRLFFCGLVSILIGSARAPQIWKSVSK